MFPDRRRNRIPRWSLGAVAILLVILGVLGMPRVTQVQPAPESEFVPSTASIQITFNRPMDRISVEARVTVDPPKAGLFEWDEDGRVLTFIPEQPWGEGERIMFQLGAGSRTNFFLPILRTHKWSFEVGIPRIAYLWPSSGRADLFARSLDDEGTTQFTDTPLGLSDFDVSYDGAKIVYAVLNEDGGSYLGLLDLVSGEDLVVFQCPDGYRCQQPKLSPNLEEVAFERVILEEGPTGRKILGQSEIWKVRLENTSRAFRLSAAEHNAVSPLWSPKGLLAYFDFSTKEIVIVEPLILPDPSVQGSIVSELGVVGAWALDGTSLIFPDMVILDDTYAKHETTGDELPLFYSHLFRQSINFGLREDLSSMGFDLVEDASPVLSPDGKWIAFTRKFLQENLWTPGRQIWVMRTDGSQATQITDSPEFNYSSLSWHPDGNALTFVRTNQNDFAAGPEVWFYEFETDELELLSRGAYSPQWIP